MSDMFGMKKKTQLDKMMHLYRLQTITACLVGTIPFYLKRNLKRYEILPQILQMWCYSCALTYLTSVVLIMASIILDHFTGALEVQSNRFTFRFLFGIMTSYSLYMQLHLIRNPKYKVHLMEVASYTLKKYERKEPNFTLRMPIHEVKILFALIYVGEFLASAIVLFDCELLIGATIPVCPVQQTKRSWLGFFWKHYYIQIYIMMVGYVMFMSAQFATTMRLLVIIVIAWTKGFERVINNECQKFKERDRFSNCNPISMTEQEAWITQRQEWKVALQYINEFISPIIVPVIFSIIVIIVYGTFTLVAFPHSIISGLMIGICVTGFIEHNLVYMGQICTIYDMSGELIRYEKHAKWLNDHHHMNLQYVQMHVKCRQRFGVRVGNFGTFTRKTNTRIWGTILEHIMTTLLTF